MTVKEIVKKYLEDNGYDGLCTKYCECFIGRLFPLSSCPLDYCTPGHKKMTPDGTLIVAAEEKEVKPKFISEAKVIHLCPDDIIVYRSDSCLSGAKLQSLKEYHDKAFGRIKGIVLDGGIDIGVIRREK